MRPYDHMSGRIVPHIKIGDAVHTKSRNNVEQEYNSLIEDE